MVLMFFGAVLAWFLVDAKKILRADGSRVILMKHPTWKSEILGLWEVLRTDSYIILLFPLFFSSNWFYTYQFNDVNLARFDIRTRALNSALYWMSQIIGAAVFGYALDISAISRSLRAKLVIGALFVLTKAIWRGGYAWQKQYTRATIAIPGYVKDDWTTDGYVGPMFLYMFYGFYDGKLVPCHGLLFSANVLQLLGRHPSIGSWARSRTTLANWRTLPASTKAFSLLEQL